jgi:integrase
MADVETKIRITSPSLPHMQVGAFYRLLEAEQEVAARALQFSILTACRIGEAISAKWDEFDFDLEVWTIPKERTKANKFHRVPLVAETLSIIERLKGLNSVWVFPGAKDGQPVPEMAAQNVLKRVQRENIAVHDFRSTFSAWAAKQTQYPKEMVELALAHSAGSAAEGHYRQSDSFEQRRALMKDWADWCGVAQPDQEQ